MLWCDNTFNNICENNITFMENVKPHIKDMIISNKYYGQSDYLCNN